jgi:spermidine/putrescine transport system permease protein
MIKASNFLTKKLSIFIPTVWLSLFVLIPISIAFIFSFLHQSTEHLASLPFTFSNYLHLIDENYLNITLRSILMSAGCTSLCLLIGYPFAFIIARSTSSRKSLYLLFVIIPCWTSSLIRTYAIMTLLKSKGIVNYILIWLHITERPLSLIYNNNAVLLGLVYTLLPFMILPLYVNIEKLDKNLMEAACDLGASKTTTFLRIILPLTLPGIVSGSLLVFLPSMTLFYIPNILGGAKAMLLGNLIESQFQVANNWPQGSAISMVLVFMTIATLLIYRFINAKQNNKQNNYV